MLIQTTKPNDWNLIMPWDSTCRKHFVFSIWIEWHFSSLGVKRLSVRLVVCELNWTHQPLIIWRFKLNLGPLQTHLIKQCSFCHWQRVAIENISNNSSSLRCRIPTLLNEPYYIQLQILVLCHLEFRPVVYVFALVVQQPLCGDFMC